MDLFRFKSSLALVLRGLTIVSLLSGIGPAVNKVQAAEDAHFLWQLGTPDHQFAEFNLAPDQYAKYSRDGFFVVGESAASRDWPYVQPGPDDNWAGNQRHSASIVFALQTAALSGACKLQVSLVDTHSIAPPTLSILINGREFIRTLPRGGGDNSLNGQAAVGKPHHFEITFPAELLRAGNNDIQITSVKGSWMLYDWIGLTAPAGTQLAPVSVHAAVLDLKSVRALVGSQDHLKQPLQIKVRRFGGGADTLTVRVEGDAPQSFPLHIGDQTIEFATFPVSQELVKNVVVEAGGQILATRAVTLKPVRQMTIYVLPHSHTDIGYTAIQTQVATQQVNNLLAGIQAARQTANYPVGSRFVWNVEVLWAADLYLQRMNEPQRADFFEAVKKGWVVLNGMYLNELTGLCRPEELTQLFRFATRLSEQTGVPMESAMISDVPGYTWGTVTAMSQAGIKYFSAAPNYFDRIGTILREWENKPFYWEGPDGKSKVLVWIPFHGYAMSHLYNRMSSALVDDFFAGLDQQSYPYDLAYVRWSGHGDNAVPDPEICEFIRDWNAKYTWPKFVISGTSQAFKALEQRYGDALPVVRGDWTPYWEDGAGSSARETAMNRQSSDRLVQAEAAFAMLNPQLFSAADFEKTWRNVLLYSEHTWGAWCSIDEPDRKETVEQWRIKQSYAEAADTQSRALLARAIASNGGLPAGEVTEMEVVNTLSWPRTELVTLSPELSKVGDVVRDEQGKPVPSQRLRSGELVFLAAHVPPLATKRYVVSTGTPKAKAGARAAGTTLDNGKLHVRVDAVTGGIVELSAKGIPCNFANTGSGEALNNYDYLIGDDLKDLKHNGPVRISIGENGPLVASLIIESDAPGCKTLRRELRLTAGQDYVEAFNLLDKARLPATSYRASEGKESVNFAFPFNVPDGDMLLDIPLGAMRPETDQMPGACKNWLTVGRWADISNPDYGINWVTLDAPLIEVGELSARLLNSQTNPDVWRQHIKRTQKLYSWAMNNHWGTNYRAYQEGPTLFRFILRPHRKPDLAAATRFATVFSQPLLARVASGKTPSAPLLHVSPADVLVTTLKPSDDGKAQIIRLYGASGKPATAKINWGTHSPKAVYYSNTSEQPGNAVGSDGICVPGFGLVTLRAEFK